MLIQQKKLIRSRDDPAHVDTILYNHDVIL